MSMYQDEVLLVTGAGGKLGTLVVAKLLERGAKKVVATTREPGKLDDLAKMGVEVRAADFDKPDTLATAFAGVDRLLLVSTDVLGKRIAQHKAVITAAAQAGVKHVIYTSAPEPLPTPEGGLMNDHFWTEAALFEQAFDWTVLRNELYTDLILMGAGHAMTSGQIFSATAGRGRAYVSREDCAAAAAGALLSAEGKRIYDITGPDAVTQDEVAGWLSEIGGKPVEHIDVPAEALAQGLKQTGLPEALVKGLVGFDVDAAAGRHEVVTKDVELLSGTKPVSVRAFLEAGLLKP
jgi:NAD(P)H dehydrogenase (quinone)